MSRMLSDFGEDFGPGDPFSDVVPSAGVSNGGYIPWTGSDTAYGPVYDPTQLAPAGAPPEGTAQTNQGAAPAPPPPPGQYFSPPPMVTMSSGAPPPVPPAGASNQSSGFWTGFINTFGQTSKPTTTMPYASTANPAVPTWVWIAGAGVAGIAVISIVLASTRRPSVAGYKRKKNRNRRKRS